MKPLKGKPFLGLAMLLGFITLLLFSLGLGFVKLLPLFGSCGVLTAAVAYYSLLWHSYRDKPPVHQRDGSYVRYEEQPMTYRLQYLFMAFFALPFIVGGIAYFAFGYTGE